LKREEQAFSLIYIVLSSMDIAAMRADNPKHIIAEYEPRHYQ
jgi:hypothetical protein